MKFILVSVVVVVAFVVHVFEDGVFVVSGCRCVHCSCYLCRFCRCLMRKSCMPCSMCWVMSVVMCWLVVPDCGWAYRCLCGVYWFVVGVENKNGLVR